MLAAGVSGHVFPGATASISYRLEDGGVEQVEASAGLLQPQGKPVHDDTIYDLASLTKPVFATICLRLVERGLLALDARAERLVADVRGTPGGSATLEQLLTHRAGVAAWGGLYLDVPHELGSGAARRWIFSEAARRGDEGPPGRQVYSDLGYIVAAELVVRATGKDLPSLLAQEVVEPLALHPLDLTYPPALSPDQQRELQRRVAPTERDEWRGRLVRGEVHDENCAALGGVGGHAGLFGTARGVGAFGRAVLDSLLDRPTTRDGKPGGPTILRSDTMRAALAPRPGGTHRLGWDGKSASDSSAGRRMSPETFGHLGFTGTSIWCDPASDVVIVLLSNRICPSRANEKIKGFRPAFHDALMGLLARP
ncbi:MAG: serine hydrolase domain-containing protein [Sandaracinaceae bacterium]